MGQAGVFARLWDEALQDYEDLIGLNFAWMSLDGSLHKAPLGGEKTASPTPRTVAKAASGAAIDGGAGQFYRLLKALF